MTWIVTDEDGRKHFVDAPSKSAAIAWCKRVLGLACCGCTRAKLEQKP